MHRFRKFKCQTKQGGTVKSLLLYAVCITFLFFGCNLSQGPAGPQGATGQDGKDGSSNVYSTILTIPKAVLADSLTFEYRTSFEIAAIDSNVCEKGAVLVYIENEGWWLLPFEWAAIEFSYSYAEGIVNIYYQGCCPPRKTWNTIPDPFKFKLVVIPPAK